jgi:fluoroquinolone transport system permease protein
MNKTLQILRSLGPIDLRGIRRDSMLSWMIVIPILSALILRWAVPPLTEALIWRYDFNLEPYYPVLLAYFFVVMSPIIFSVLVGFLLLDEKDDRTLTALLITPLSINSYLAYRVALPVILTILLMFIIFPLANLGELTFGPLLLTAISAAPMSPMFAMYLASMAQNKVQGFALTKLSGFVLFVPIFAYFIDSGWEIAFGIIPTYWPMKVYWTFTAGEPKAWIYVLVAVFYQSFVTWLFVRRFNKTMHR